MTATKSEVRKQLATGTPLAFAPVVEKFSAGICNTFLLHGEINDYASALMKAKWADFLRIRYSASRQIVVSFNPLEGFSFLNEKVEGKFREACGIDNQPAEEENDFMKAITGATGATGGENEKRPLPSNAVQAFQLITRAILNTDFSGEIAVIIEYPEALAPKSQSPAALQPNDRLAYVALAQWASNFKYSTTNNILFIVASDTADLHEAISENWTSIPIGLPTTIERTLFIETFLNDTGGYTLDESLSIKGYATLTAGLSFVEIENAIMSGQEDEKTGAIRIEAGAVKKSKIEAFTRNAEGITLMNPNITFQNIGGLQWLKTYFREEVIEPMLTGQLWAVPMGIIFAGAPGTGKTIMVEGIAGEAELAVIKVDFSKIVSKWQGEGERNLRKFFSIVTRYAPAIIFIDELDQNTSRGGGTGNNQQESRIFSMLMEFMSDTSHRGKIIFVAATNRPDLIDSALKRPGRFDKTVVFPVPNREERIDLFNVFSKKYGFEIGASVPEKALDNTENWTGAELEPLIIKARKYNERKNLSPELALIAASERLLPNTGDKQEMTDYALKDINDIDLLPPQLIERFNQLRNTKTKEQEAQEVEYSEVTRKRRK